MAGTSCVPSAFSSSFAPRSGILTSDSLIGIGSPTSTWLRSHSVRIHPANTLFFTVLTVAYYPALLYYDYALTVGRERRLFWSRQGLKQWGSLLFFLNRYLGVLGHAPVFVQAFATPRVAMSFFCGHLQFYHQMLAIIMQAIVGCMSLYTNQPTTYLQKLNTPSNSYFYREDLCFVR